MPPFQSQNWGKRRERTLSSYMEITPLTQLRCQSTASQACPLSAPECRGCACKWKTTDTCGKWPASTPHQLSQINLMLTIWITVHSDKLYWGNKWSLINHLFIIHSFFYSLHIYLNRVSHGKMDIIHGPGPEPLLSFWIVMLTRESPSLCWCLLSPPLPQNKQIIEQIRWTPS